VRVAWIMDSRWRSFGPVQSFYQCQCRYGVFVEGLTSDTTCWPYINFNGGFFGQFIAALHFYRSIYGPEDCVAVCRVGC